jgi:MFS family permease
MIDLSMFRNRMFSVNLVTGFFTFVVGAGTMILFPLYLQNVLSFGPQQAGLMMAITPLTVALVAPFSGALSDRVSSRLITAIGLGVMLIGFSLVSTLSAETSVPGYLLRFIPVGIGIGLFQSPNNSAIMGSAPRERSGVASSLLSLTRTVGQTTGIALLGAFWERRVTALAGGIEFQSVVLAPIEAQVGGLRQTIYLVVVILILTLGLSLWALSTWLRESNVSHGQNTNSLSS